MARRKFRTEDEKTIPEMADELARETVRGMYKDGKLTPQGRSLAKLMDRIMPDEKVDEWGWNLSRKERAAIKKRAADACAPFGFAVGESPLRSVASAAHLLSMPSCILACAEGVRLPEGA